MGCIIFCLKQSLFYKNNFMIKILLHIRILAFFCILINTLSCESISELPEPQIQLGIAKISGRIIDKQNQIKKENRILTLYVYYPINASTEQFIIHPKEDGSFYLEVPTETDYSISFLNINNECSNMLIGLAAKEENLIEIIYDETGKSQINISNSFPLTSYDVTNSANIMNRMIEGNHPYRKIAPEEHLYKKSADYYIDYSMKILKYRQEIADIDSSLSISGKQILKNEIKLFLINNMFINYEEMMYINFLNENSGKNVDDYIAPSHPNKSFYKFFKEMHLNDPKLLYSSEYYKLFQFILGNEVFSIPKIDENPIDTWLYEVKMNLSDLVGFDHGLFYDILTANAYARQLNEELEPLTEKQKENISSYWKNGEIAKILFRKNEEVIELSKHKQPAVVNEISLVPKDKVIEIITSKYKNKVVFVDLWATWCAPCLSAMTEFRKTKKDFINKDVVFVYITNTTSPRKLWEEKIKGIGGEYFYLEDSQWDYIMSHFGFDGIPSYLLYNKDGVLINKFTSFPGNEKVKDLINGLL